MQACEHVCTCPTCPTCPTRPAKQAGTAWVRCPAESSTAQLGCGVHGALCQRSMTVIAKWHMNSGDARAAARIHRVPSHSHAAAALTCEWHDSAFTAHAAHSIYSLCSTSAPVVNRKRCAGHSPQSQPRGCNCWRASGSTTAQHEFSVARPAAWVWCIKRCHCRMHAAAATDSTV